MSLIYNIDFEVASAVFLVIFFLFMKLQYSMQSKINQEFQKLTVFVLLADAMDVATAVTISYAAVLPVWLNLLLNTLYFMAIAAVGYQFMYYSWICVDKERKKNLLLSLNRILMFVPFIILTVNLCNGCIFSISETGEYVHGPIYLVVYIIPYYFIGWSAVILLSRFNSFQKWQRISIILYLVLGFGGAALQMLFFPDVLLAMFTVSLALVMILFTMETPDYQELVKTIDELTETREEAEKAKESAQEANRAKTDFLANMSHEIRTPINAILGYNEMIMKETKESNSAEYAMNVQAAGRTLLSLVNDVLDFTSIEKGALMLEKAPYYVPSLIQDMVTYAEVNAQKKNLELRLMIDENLPKQLSGDAVRLMQIYNNLISNAVKYTMEGFVEIRISWQKTGGTSGVMAAAVADSGIGIKEEDISRIRESFSRTDVQKTRSIQGLGLGLTIVTRLLKLMDGELQIESEYGKGSVFSFRVEQEIVEEEAIGKLGDIVLSEEQSKAGGEEGFTAPAARILTVDDNVMNLDVFCRILKDTKMEIDTANNGAEALELIRKNSYHMIFFDHMMPIMDGMEALRIIKKEKLCPDTPVIVLTANAVAGEKQAYLDAGFDDYLSKPIVSRQLREMVHQYLPENLLENAITENAFPAVSTAAHEGAENSVQADAGLPARLKGVLDTDIGLGYCCDSEEFYREMIVTYIENRKTGTLDEAFREEDWENYRITVHALKSTSLSIGAAALSEQAKALEMAAKENRIDDIRAGHPPMMADYQKLLNDLEAAVGEAQDAQAVLEEKEGRSHILVVDDDAMNLRIAEKMLMENFMVSSVDSGEKALAFLRSNVPDLILLDLHMPVMDGFEVMKKLQDNSIYREIPVIFLTADDGRDVEVKGFQAGALDFIKKPFIADIMMQRVNRILQLDRLQKNLQQEVEKQTKVAEARRQKVERLSLQIMSTLAATIDAKDKYTNGHSARVAEYAKKIAERIGKSEQEQEDIYYVGLLHDIGKIGIPEEIINKTSRLTDEEYEIIKTHPVIGNNILKNISELQDIGVGARWHHERYDGKGYPDRLKGDEIPEVARIIGVVDAYDAMTSKRSYRDIMPQEIVRGEIEKGKGSQFDPYYADVMLALIDEDTEYKMHEA